MSERPNPAHSLDGGIPLRFRFERRWPAASDVHRWGKSRRSPDMRNRLA
jgi:hypothetical protein